MAERKVIFIIPAFNEAANLPLLLENIDLKMKAIGYPYTVIIVDDGSTDGSDVIFKDFSRRLPLRIIRHQANRGVGEAFRTGFREAMTMASPEDILITKEADNTSDINILGKIIKKVEEGYDLVLASCYAPEGKIIGTSFYRYFLSSTANWLIRTFFPLTAIHTYSSFYRGYKAELISRAFSRYGEQFIEEDSFACMVELLLKLSRFHPKITEVPLILYFNARKGKSKMKVLATIFGYMRVIRNEWLGRRRKIEGTPP